MTQSNRTPRDLQAYIDAHQIQAELLPELGHTPTVPAAAAVLGVAPEQIIKTLLFLVEPRAGAALVAPAVVVISHGERRVRPALLAAHLGVANGRIKLAPPATVLAQLGYPAGGVPPFGHANPTPVILDASVVQAAVHFAGALYGGGGDDRTMLRVQLDELLRTLNPAVVAVSGE